jgi:hypothetical protein
VISRRREEQVLEHDADEDDRQSDEEDNEETPRSRAVRFCTTP